MNSIRFSMKKFGALSVALVGSIMIAGNGITTVPSRSTQ